MRLALIQQPCSTDRKANRKKGLTAVEKAVNKNAQVICFAELAFEPFYPQTPATSSSLKFAEPIPGPTTDQFSEIAVKHNLVIVLNLFEQDGKQTYDTSPVINTNGKILGKTRMVHVPDYPGFHEREYYNHGNNGTPVYETRYGKIGVAICYDRHYPEYMRALALKGAQVVLVPQAGVVDEWPAGLYEAEMRVAAFQNGFFLGLCNRVGAEPHLTFAGESFVCDPFGHVIARAKKIKEDILICDLDLNQIEQCPAQKLFLPDRRPELYDQWLNK